MNWREKQRAIAVAQFDSFVPPPQVKLSDADLRRIMEAGGIWQAERADEFRGVVLDAHTDAFLEEQLSRKHITKAKLLDALTDAEKQIGRLRKSLCDTDLCTHLIHFAALEVLRRDATDRNAVKAASDHVAQDLDAIDRMADLLARMIQDTEGWPHR